MKSPEVPWPLEFEAIRSNKIMDLRLELETALPWERQAILDEIYVIKHTSYEFFKRTALAEGRTRKKRRRS
tara:strand:+ start:253 stop:465 length:213 start_codon:yes stop_codon:yes gene_type:complete